MRNFILSISIALLLTGCLTTHGLDKMVEHKIASQLMKTNLLDTTHLVLKTDKLLLTEAPSKSQVLNSFFIPALLYWGWENTLICELNNHYYINLFSQALNRKKTDNKWNEILKNKKLEITLDSVPNQFIYSSKGMVLFLFSDCSYNFSKGLFPADQLFKISYRLLDKNEVVKQGSFWTKYTRPEHPTNQTDKHFVEKFLDIQKDFFTTESANLIQQIENDL
jgi:hypothetical protein